MRGLKHKVTSSPPGRPVASFTDAWIETTRIRNIPFPRLVASFTDAWIETVLPKWLTYRERVASFTDAWIETSKGGCPSSIIKSHLLQMRGLKLNKRVNIVSIYSRIFYRCVD